ncbi:MAG: DUF3486 family protein [Gammaproteobacteria bacterium]|nr:DUF3486 family protein [Gammaproteobacteria bacterium]
MPKRNWLDSLPKDVREKIETIFIEGNFQNYSKLTNKINKILASAGYEVIARSTIHNRGQILQKEFKQSLKKHMDLEALAQIVRQKLGNDDGAINELIARTHQQETYNFLTTAKFDVEGKISVRDFAALGKSIAAINQAMLQQQRRQDEVKQRAKSVELDMRKRLCSGAQELDVKIKTVLNQLRKDVEGSVDAGDDHEKIKDKLAQGTNDIAEIIIDVVKDKDGVYKPVGLSDNRALDTTQKILGTSSDV